MTYLIDDNYCLLQRVTDPDSEEVIAEPGDSVNRVYSVMPFMTVWDRIILQGDDIRLCV